MRRRNRRKRKRRRRRVNGFGNRNTIGSRSVRGIQSKVNGSRLEWFVNY